MGDIGSDVIANNQITFTAFKEIDGGMKLKQCMGLDPAGMIPGMIKNAMSRRMAQGLPIMVDYWMNGTIPPPAI